MLAPRYYTAFRCLAGACTHSCCIGWEIDVDADTLAYYRALPAPIGEDILRGITEGEDGAHFALCANGKCPNLDERGLCRIISTLGEGALCDICREHPRYYNEVAGRLEVGIGAACEAAARLILTSDAYAEIVSVDGDADTVTVGDFDVLAAREAVYGVLGARSRPYEKRRGEIAAACGFAYDAARATSLLSALEYMDEAHRDLLSGVVSEPRGETDTALCERFLAYLIYRHASPATSEAAFAAALRGALLIEALFARLLASGTDAVQAAILLSEELEYSEENMAQILQ